nr:MAG TPA: hypothetical protein [Caudoviricetes sp.]
MLFSDYLNEAEESAYDQMKKAYTEISKKYNVTNLDVFKSTEPEVQDFVDQYKAQFVSYLEKEKHYVNIQKWVAQAERQKANKTVFVLKVKYENMVGFDVHSVYRKEQDAVKASKAVKQEPDVNKVAIVQKPYYI